MLLTKYKPSRSYNTYSRILSRFWILQILKNSTGSLSHGRYNRTLASTATLSRSSEGPRQHLRTISTTQGSQHKHRQRRRKTRKSSSLTSIYLPLRQHYAPLRNRRPLALYPYYNGRPPAHHRRLLVLRQPIRSH